MASLSIGDIVLCSQIACRLLAAATVGRREAPRDLRELDNVLFALNCSLNHLQQVAAGISYRNLDRTPSTVDVQQNLGLMVRSCRQVLEDLEKKTIKYRDTMKGPSSPQSSEDAGPSRSVRFKSQWRRFMWDFKGDSSTRYRQKLETHTATINLMLSACIWSATDRIENDNRRQNERIEALFYQASHRNVRFSALMHNVHLQVASSHPSGSHLLSLPPALPESLAG